MRAAPQPAWAQDRPDGAAKRRRERASQRFMDPERFILIDEIGLRPT